MSWVKILSVCAVCLVVGGAVGAGVGITSAKSLTDNGSSGKCLNEVFFFIAYEK